MTTSPDHLAKGEDLAAARAAHRELMTQVNR